MVLCLFQSADQLKSVLDLGAFDFELLKGDGKGIGFYFRCCHNYNSAANWSPVVSTVEAFFNRSPMLPDVVSDEVA